MIEYQELELEVAMLMTIYCLYILGMSMIFYLFCQLKSRDRKTKDASKVPMLPFVFVKYLAL